MARPMNPLPDSGPQDKLVVFAADLRALRTKAGKPTLAEMARRTGASVAALSNAHSGRRLPRWQTVENYVRACGAESSGWRSRWDSVQLAQRIAHAQDGHAPLMKRWASTRQLTPPQWARTGADLARALDQMRHFRGLSLRGLARRTPGFSHHTYGAVLRGDRPVTADVLLAILHSCGVQPDETRRWMQALARVRPAEELRVRTLLSRLPEPRMRALHMPHGGRGNPMRP
ncbi:helix-turn-helix transcriptional regulator [Streptomyces sp. NPDC056045]|uniref:helix-turn-helix transcriptional regulator n=1 Tax=Streptomyces sp. NPDC056045 TaxID=3345691 RepID=UPI0035E32ED9